MYKEISETFECNGLRFRVAKDKGKMKCTDCNGTSCYFDNVKLNCGTLRDEGLIPECCWIDRKDRTSIVFIKEDYNG